MSSKDAWSRLRDLVQARGTFREVERALKLHKGYLSEQRVSVDVGTVLRILQVIGVDAGEFFRGLQGPAGKVPGVPLEGEDPGGEIERAGLMAAQRMGLALPEQHLSSTVSIGQRPSRSYGEEWLERVDADRYDDPATAAREIRDHLREVEPPKLYPGSLGSSPPATA